MSDDAPRTEINLLDTMERLRAEKFPHIPREVMREVLSLHADASTSSIDLVNKVDALIQKHAPGAN